MPREKSSPVVSSFPLQTVVEHGIADDLGDQPEEIQQRTFRFALRIVKLCRVLDETPGVSWTISRQLLRSGTSIGANVEEGQGSQSKADFISKYAIACKEARETHYWLRLLVASEILPESRLSELIDESNQLVAILTTIVKKTKRGMTNKSKKSEGSKKGEE